MIPVFRPAVGQEEIDAVTEVLRSGWWGMGPKTKQFEDKFATFLGVPHGVAVNSATAALHLALKVADVEGGEVITTPMTFVSSNHAILYNNATPVFADIEPDTLNIDPNDVEKRVTSMTKAIMVVHYGGHACDMEPILDIAHKHNLKVIEDAAHGCGGKYKGKMLGTLGQFGCFSFHAVKNLATGDGGMITTSDPEAAAHIRRLSWLGITKGTWDRVEGEGYSWEYNVEEAGFKCHMNDITAAIGLAQLNKLGKTNGWRRHLAERYSRLLADVDWVEKPFEKQYAYSSWHNYVIKVAHPEDRNRLMEYLKTKGISTGMHYIPNHLYQMYRPYVTEALPITESVWKRIITLPLFPDLTEDQQDYIVAAIKKYRSAKK